MRPAVAADIPRMVEMGARFHEAASLPSTYDGEAIAAMLAGLIESEDGAVFINETGIIGGTLSRAYCDPNWIMAVELFWWASGGGLELLRGFERWAEEVGADEVRMTSIVALDRADKILRRKGYAPTEISYSKRV